MDNIALMDIFSDLRPDEIEQIIEYVGVEIYKSGDIVFSENDTGRKLYFVKKGELILEMGGRMVKTIKMGDSFGEIALINGSIRFGTVIAKKQSELLCFKGDVLFDNEKVPPQIALRIFRKMAIKVTKYLRSSNFTTTKQLIEDGESDSVEFKSTLRTNLHTNKFDRIMEHAVLKTIAGFLNTEGGTLLIGVNDQGEILGLEADKFANDDKAMLHLTKMVTDRISQQHMSFIECYFEQYEQGKVLRLDVRPAKSPAYLEKFNEEKFYIRTGPATSSMRISEHYDYVRNRFNPTIY